MAVGRFSKRSNLVYSLMYIHTWFLKKEDVVVYVYQYNTTPYYAHEQDKEALFAENRTVGLLILHSLVVVVVVDSVFDSMVGYRLK